MKNAFRIRGDHAVIYIKRRDGMVLIVLIDTDDIEKVTSIKHSWYACKSKNNSFYVYGRIGKEVVALHRYVLGINTPGKKIQVDHFNHNTLDDRKCNLRVLDPSGNQQNREGAMKNSKTGIRGVSWNKKLKKWEVQIELNGKSVYHKMVHSIKIAEKLAIKARQKFMPYSKEAANKK